MYETKNSKHCNHGARPRSLRAKAAHHIAQWATVSMGNRVSKNGSKYAHVAVASTSDPLPKLQSAHQRPTWMLMLLEFIGNTKYYTNYST